MTRKKLAHLIWKLWKRRNFYKRWYEYEVDERKIWFGHLDDLTIQLKDYKKEDPSHGNVG